MGSTLIAIQPYISQNISQKKTSTNIAWVTILNVSFEWVKNRKVVEDILNWDELFENINITKFSRWMM